MSEPKVLDSNPNSITLAQAQEWLSAESRNGAGAICPCCSQKDKTVKRKVTPAQAAILVLLHRTYQIGDEVAVQDFVGQLSDKELAQTRDISRLVYWDLLEATQNEKVMRLCDGGYYFVFKQHKITKEVWVRDEQVVGREGKLVDLITVLGSKFDINTLMHMQLPSPKAQTTIPETNGHA